MGAEHLRNRRVVVLPALDRDERADDGHRNGEAADEDGGEAPAEEGREPAGRRGGQAQRPLDEPDERRVHLENRRRGDDPDPQEVDGDAGDALPDGRPERGPVGVEAGQQPVAELDAGVGGGRDGGNEEPPRQRHERVGEERPDVGELDGRQREEPAECPAVRIERPGHEDQGDGPGDDAECPGLELRMAYRAVGADEGADPVPVVAELVAGVRDREGRKDRRHLVEEHRERQREHDDGTLKHPYLDRAVGKVRVRGVGRLHYDGPAPLSSRARRLVNTCGHPELSLCARIYTKYLPWGAGSRRVTARGYPRERPYGPVRLASARSPRACVSSAPAPTYPQ